MQLVCLDLEGVLLPEIWIAVARKTGLEELERTTRDEPDYDKLMRYRLDILKREGIGIREIHEVIGTMEPLPGAIEFTEWLESRVPLIILSDTFTQFPQPLMAQLGRPTLFCHELIVGTNGTIESYKLRLKDHKRKTVKAFKDLNFEVIAAGDSYNDLTMLQVADHGILFRPPEKMKAEYPDFPVAEDHAALREHIERRLS